MAQNIETARAIAYDRGLINVSEPFSPTGNPALLSLRNNFRFNLELYRAKTNNYRISLSYPLSSVTGLGISYFYRSRSDIKNISSGIFGVINKSQTFLFSLGHDFLFHWGQQLEIDFELNRFSTINLIDKKNIPFSNNQKVKCFYRIGLFHQIFDKLSVGLLSPPIFNFEYQTFTESEQPVETNLTYWQEQGTDTKLHLLAVEWQPMQNLSLALSNRSISGSNNLQLASEIQIKKLTLTSAFCKRDEQDNLDVIFGLGSHFKGFDLFSAYEKNEKTFRLAISFAPEQMKNLIEIEKVEMETQTFYPYRIQHGVPNYLVKMAIKNKSENPVEITVKLSGRQLPSVTKSMRLEKKNNSIIEIPVPAELKNVSPGKYSYDINTIAYYRGKQSIKRSIAFEMKDKHDWAGDPNDLKYFLMPGEKRIKAEARRIISLHSKEKNNGDVLKLIKHFYNFIRYSINYVSDPKPINQNHDSVQYPTETIASRSGDCEDLSVLMISLLKSVGIDGSFVQIKNPESGEGHIFIIFDSQKNLSRIIADDENLQNYIVRTNNKQKQKFYIPLELTKADCSFEEAWFYAAKMYFDIAVKKKGLYNGNVKIVDAF